MQVEKVKNKWVINLKVKTGFFIGYFMLVLFSGMTCVWISECCIDNRKTFEFLRNIGDLWYVVLVFGLLIGTVLYVHLFSYLPEIVINIIIAGMEAGASRKQIFFGVLKYGFFAQMPFPIPLDYCWGRYGWPYMDYPEIDYRRIFE